jgi:hypothetical protein
VKKKELYVKIKPILLLFTLSFVALLFVVVINYLKGDSKPILLNQQTQELVIVENPSEISNSMDTSTIKKVEESEEGLVLNAVDTSKGCTSAKIKIQSYSVCNAQGGTPVDYKSGHRSGTRVSKNAKIELVEVSVPLELLSGSNVKDSNRKLTSTTPIYKAAGEQFDEKIANVQLPPGQNIIEYTSPVQDSPFATPYSTAFGQKPDQKTEEGDIVVDQKLVNACEHCNNKSNVNPDKSNKIATFLMNKTHRYPGQLEKVDAQKAIEDCGQAQFIDWPSSSRKACNYWITQALVDIIQDIADYKWNECNRPDKYDANGNLIPRSEDCIYVEDIIVVMNSPFGSDKECPDGVCTNAFMNTRNKVAMYPAAAGKYSDKVYYTTACKVRIEGIVGSSTVKCAWDFSHLYKERKLSEFDDIPKLEATPSKDEYTKFLTDEASKRSGETPVKIF